MSMRKTDEERMRGRAIGVPFPPNRIPELNALAEKNGLTRAAQIRMLLLNKLDELKKQSDNSNQGGRRNERTDED
jgi:hypothetical protein